MWRDMVGGSGDENKRSIEPTTRSSCRMSSSSLRWRCRGRLPTRYCVCSSRRSEPRSTSGRERCVATHSASLAGSSDLSAVESVTGAVSLAHSSQAKAAR